MEIHNLIIAGDMNTNLDDLSALPHSAHRSTRDTYPTHLLALVNEYNLMDIWRRKNPNSQRGTFHRNQYSSRLDCIFAPAYIIPSVTSININPEPLSDHCSVTLEVNVTPSLRGPGFWRFDNNLLTDAAFMQGMGAHIAEALIGDFTDPNVHWEWIKFKIREFTLSYVTNRIREQKKHTTALEKRLQFLAETHDLSDSSDIALEAQSIKRELAEILQAKATRAIFKAKVKWLCLGEKPSAYFLGLERRLSKDKHISTLKDEHGQILTDPSDILAYESRYFADIYREDPTLLSPVQDLPLNSEDVPHISQSHRNLINTPFTHKDFFDALKQLNKNRSPGSDGITPEFYIAFWDLLQNIFYESIMFSIQQGSLSQEQRTDIITLIPKKSDRSL